MTTRLPDPVRQAALWIILQTEAKHRSMDGPLRAAADSFEERDRRFLWMLVQETVRWKARLDAVVAPLLTRPIGSLDMQVRVILRMAACQVCLLDQVPPHAIVDEGVRLAQRFAPIGADRLVNAVSRRLTDDGRARWNLLDSTGDPRSWMVGTSHPAWLIDRWRRRLGQERTRAVLEWDNQRPPVWLRARPGGDAPPGDPGWVPNTYRMPIGYRPGEDPVFQQGEWTAQDPGETLVGLIPPPVEGEVPVLDLCCSPGTKTSHLSERYGHVIAADRSRGKVRRARDTIRRTRSSAHLVVADGLRSPFRTGVAGGVLVDAPCSNLGVLRRRVDARWNVRPSDLGKHGKQQLRLLSAAAVLPRVGGWLLYSVCSTEPEETDRVRSVFLERHPWYRPLPLAIQIPPEFMPAEGVLRLLPGDGDCDGVYASLFIRSGEASE